MKIDKRYVDLSPSSPVSINASNIYYDHLYTIKDKINEISEPSYIINIVRTVDGPGSGLDADLLDGYHASSFVKVDDYEDIDVLNKIKNVDGHNSGLDADLLDGYHASSFVKVDDYEDIDVLNKIKNVDGHNSGLDADLLDGQHASSFALSTHNHDSTYVKLTDYEDIDVLDKIKNVDGSGSGLDADLLDGQHASSFSLTTHNHDSTYVKLTDYEDSDVLNKIKNVDGSGSGLDADLLDGQHASSFALSTHNHDSTYVKLTDYEDIDVLDKIKNVDGHNSGLDADLLDGLHSSSFARVDIVPVFSGGSGGNEGGEISLLRNTSYPSDEKQMIDNMILDVNYNKFRIFTRFQDDPPNQARGFLFYVYKGFIDIFDPQYTRRIIPHGSSYISSSVNATLNYIYFVDTNSSAITITLPNTGLEVLSFVSIVDMYGKCDINNITVLRNGNPINGINEDFVIDVPYITVMFRWIGSTWVVSF